MACATLSLKRSHEFDPLSPRRPKRRRCTPMAVSPSQSTSSKPVSVFKEATPSFSKEQLADSIRSEIKRLQHRRQLVQATSTTHPLSASSQSDSGSDSEQPTTCNLSPPATQIKKDNTPLFTFKQMTTLCERIVKERTDRLCEEYDKVLNSKLAEQYEAFLKFNHDQIQRNFSHRNDDVSYLS